MTGSGNGATPVCPVAIIRGLLIVDLASPDPRNSAANKTCTTHSATATGRSRQ
jgi:hypothetical protein